jgi:acetoacetyl-CoA reductase
MTGSMSDKVLEKIKGNIPLGRLGQPDEIAQMVAYLASEEAGFITGATLKINGGQYM